MKKSDKNLFPTSLRPISQEFIKLGKVDLALQIQSILLTGGSDDMVLTKIEKLAKQTVKLLDEPLSLD